MNHKPKKEIIYKKIFIHIYIYLYIDIYIYIYIYVSVSIFASPYMIIIYGPHATLFDNFGFVEEVREGERVRDERERNREREREREREKR
jgi:hypothetical protein